LRDIIVVFFFQAEDGIRDRNVTGVQTYALPISGIATTSAASSTVPRSTKMGPSGLKRDHAQKFTAKPSIAITNAVVRWALVGAEIGRASCRERQAIRGGGV